MKPEIMETTRDFDDEIANDATPEAEADGVLGHATAFDAAVDIFNPHASLGHDPIVGFLVRLEMTNPVFLDRLADCHPIQRKGKKAESLE